MGACTVRQPMASQVAVHKHRWTVKEECGADVCKVCGYHKRVEKCFCGYSDAKPR